MFTSYSERNISFLYPLKYWDTDVSTVRVTIERRGKVREYRCHYHSYGRISHLYFSPTKYDARVCIDFTKATLKQVAKEMTGKVKVQ